jgi:hypothetical protein
MNNQQHIAKLSEDKYKDKILAQIAQMVSI